MCAFTFSLSNAQSNPMESTKSIEALVAKHQAIGTTAGSITDYFTLDEIEKLANYYATENAMKATLGGPDFQTNGGASLAYGGETVLYNSLVSFDPSAPAVLTQIGTGSGNSNFEGAGAISNTDVNTGYVINIAGQVYRVNVTTGAYTLIGNIGVTDLNGLEFNPVDGQLYGVTGTSLYRFDPEALTATFIGNLGTTVAIALAIDDEGNAYTYDLNDDSLYSVNLSNGTASYIGYIGFDANYGQGLAWDAATDTFYMAAFNNTAFRAELRSVNVSTGATTLVGAFTPGTLSQVAWVSFPFESATGGDCSWTVTVWGDGFGDEVSWQLRSGGVTVLSGGPYSDIPFFDSQSITAAGPVEFYIESMGVFNDNAVSYTIENENGIILAGGIPGGSEATHSDLNCSDTPPPPPSACEDFVVPSNGMENGLFFGGDTAQRVAADVPTADVPFTVYGMEPTVAGEATMFNFIIYEDAGGLPGLELATRTGTIYDSVVTGNNFGFDFIKYTVGFDEPFEFEANTTYWIEVESDAVAWETTSVPTSMLGNDDVFWNINVSGWTPTGGSQYVFNLVCENLGLSDLSSYDFSYYPNPATHTLNIKAQKPVESVSVINLAGQQVMSNMKVNADGQINISALPVGTYVFKVVLQGGQVETFKIIKK